VKVFVYRNLHKEGNVYSLKALDGPAKGRVVAHAHGVMLEDCQFVVSETGRKRVLKEKRKNVHAGIVGELVSVAGYQTRIHVAKLIEALPQYNDESWLKTFNPGIPVTYNPYLYTSFVIKGTTTPIFKAEKVMFFHHRVEAFFKQKGQKETHLK